MNLPIRGRSATIVIQRVVEEVGVGNIGQISPAIGIIVICIVPYSMSVSG